MAYRLKAGEPVTQAVVRIALEELESAAKGLSGKNRRNRDTAIHEARKSVKKIRALLRLMGSDLGSAFPRENRRFRALGRKLSRFRDPAAAIETLDQLVAAYPEELSSVQVPMRRTLTQHKHECERRYGIIRATAVIAAAFRDAKDRVRKWPLRYDGFAAIEPGLAKTLRRGRRALALVRQDPSPENYHEWRKRVKDHWYHVSLLADASAPSMRGYLKSLHRLETWLGDDHNLVMLREKVAAHPHDYGPPQGVEQFLDVAGQCEEKLRAKARQLGASIYSENPSRFIGRMKRAFRGDNAVSG